MTTYQALFEPGDDGWTIITFPDFGWGVSNGKGEEDSISMAADLLQTLIQDYINKDKDLPTPAKRRGRQYRAIALPALPSAKVELYLAMRAGSVSKAELSRRVGIHKANFNRLLNLGHASRFDQIEAALQALGKRIVLTVEDAA